MRFNVNLAAVHAYLCADGYVIKNPKTQKQKYYMIGFRNTNLILLKDFQKRFEKIFGKKPYIVKEGRCRIGSKEIYQKLTKKFGSFYSWKWKMPELDEKLSVIWLRSFFDCEGWAFCKSHQNRHIGLDCVNEKGLKQIQLALERLQICSIIKKRKNRNTSSLNIYGRSNLIEFENKIGFLHPTKKEKLKEIMNDFVNYYWDFPLNKKKLRKFIKNIMWEKAKIKKNTWIVRVISNKEKNLLKLRKGLNRLFTIESKVNKRINGIGTIYYQLDINKKEEVKKVIKNNLLNNYEKEKWLKLRR